MIDQTTYNKTILLRNAAADFSLIQKKYALVTRKKGTHNLVTIPKPLSSQKLKLNGSVCMPMTRIAIKSFAISIVPFIFFDFSIPSITIILAFIIKYLREIIAENGRSEHGLTGADSKAKLNWIMIN